MSGPGASVNLQARVTCPHCWHHFAPEDILWIAQHPDLLGDPRLGGEQQQRFLPSRFSVEGNAIDAKGFPCHSLACPNCHLAVPRALIELQPLFTSILGAPASGKSYFLAAMTWPFIFSLKPLPNHPGYATMARLSRALCLYDNAGEHFLPGQDTVGSPMTRHLARSPLSRRERARVRAPCMLFFLFDPTQDPRFRKACAGKTHDPQMVEGSRTMRQETILLEAADRIRRYGGLAQGEQHSAPLIVVVTKYDAWRSLLGGMELPMIYALCRWMKGLLARWKGAPTRALLSACGCAQAG